VNELTGLAVALVGVSLTLLAGGGTGRWRGLRTAAAAVPLVAAAVLVLPNFLPLAPAADETLHDTYGELILSRNEDDPADPSGGQGGDTPRPKAEPQPAPVPAPPEPDAEPEPAPDTAPKEAPTPPPVAEAPKDPMPPPVAEAPKDPPPPPKLEQRPEPGPAPRQEPAPRPAPGRGEVTPGGKGIDPAVFWRMVADFVNRVLREGGKLGQVSVSLAWDNINDLDLYVETGDGKVISFSDPKSACGGELDVDMNRDDEEASARAVENVVWPKGFKPNGPIRIYVAHFHERKGTDCQGPTKFRIMVRDGSPLPRIFTGEIRHDPTNRRRQQFVAEVPIR
jgi:hypothetical protein